MYLSPAQLRLCAAQKFLYRGLFFTSQMVDLNKNLYTKESGVA
jgi:hypothetical protein